MPRLRRATRRPADSPPAVLFIIAGLGLFAVLGLIFAGTLLLSIRRAQTNPAAAPQSNLAAERAKPAAERFAGLLCYCPPDAISLTAVDLAAESADPATRDAADLLIAHWDRARDRRFGKVPFSAADLEAVVAARGPAGDLVRRPEARRGTITALRFKQPIDPPTVLRGAGAAGRTVEDFQSADGTQCYLLTGSPAGICLTFPDERTVLVATTRAEIEEATRRRPGRVELAGALRTVLDESPGTVVDAVLERGSPEADAPGRFALRPVAVFAARDRQAAAVWFATRGADVRYGECVLVAVPDQAAPARTALRQQLQDRRGAPPGLRVVDAYRLLAANAEVGGSGAQLTLHGTVPRAAFADALKELLGPSRPAKR